jgi:transposase-like protein
VAARRRPREFWERLVAEVERSTIERTARQHGVSTKALTWWRWKLGAKPTVQREPSLLPVVFTAGERAVEEAPHVIAIELDRCVTFRVPVGSDEQYVAALVAAVRSTC